MHFFAFSRLSFAAFELRFFSPRKAPSRLEAPFYLPDDVYRVLLSPFRFSRAVLPTLRGARSLEIRLKSFSVRPYSPLRRVPRPGSPVRYVRPPTPLIRRQFYLIEGFIVIIQ